MSYNKLNCPPYNHIVATDSNSFQWASSIHILSIPKIIPKFFPPLACLWFSILFVYSSTIFVYLGWEDALGIDFHNVPFISFVHSLALACLCRDRKYLCPLNWRHQVTGAKKKIRNIFSQHQICVVDCCRKRCLEPEKKSTRQSHDHEVYDVFLCFSLFVSFGINIVLLDFLSNSSIRTFICYMMSRRNGRVVKVVKKPMR